MTPAFRSKYPPQWEELARQCKERAGWRCEHCLAAQESIAVSKAGRRYFIYLHAAHKNHDQGNPEPELLCLCVSCHARYDWQHKQREAQLRLERLKHLKRLIDAGIVTIEAFYDC